MRIYVGIKPDLKREPFRSAETPTEKSHPQYYAVIGPFRTARAANLMLTPNVYNCVQDAEAAANHEQLEYKDGKVTLTRPDGRTYTFASYDNARDSHRRGAFVLGDLPHFSIPKRLKAKVLKFFYPCDSLAYLEKHGYIAS